MTNNDDRFDYQAQQEQDEQQQIEEEFERVSWEIDCLMKRREQLRADIDDALSLKGVK